MKRSTLAVAVAILCLKSSVSADVLTFSLTSSNADALAAFDGGTNGTYQFSSGTGITLDLFAEVIYSGAATGVDGELNVTASGLAVNTDADNNDGLSDAAGSLDAFTGSFGPIPSDSKDRGEAIRFSIIASNVVLDSLSLIGLDLSGFTDDDTGNNDIAGPSGSSDAGRIVFGVADFIEFDEDVGDGSAANIDPGSNEVTVSRAIALNQTFLVQHYSGDGFGINSLTFNATSSATAAVPEPSSVFALLALGSAGLVWRRRRTVGSEA